MSDDHNMRKQPTNSTFGKGPTPTYSWIAGLRQLSKIWKPVLRTCLRTFAAIITIIHFWLYALLTGLTYTLNETRPQIHTWRQRCVKFLERGHNLTQSGIKGSMKNRMALWALTFIGVLPYLRPSPFSRWTSFVIGSIFLMCTRWSPLGAYSRQWKVQSRIYSSK